MFAIDHAATALLIKRRFPAQPMWPVLISVQLMEFAWVGLNLLGVERTTTESSVASVKDIHLAHMPYSHSVATMLGASALVWFITAILLKRRRLGIAIAVGVASHLFLDLLTHAPDIALAPGMGNIKLGLGLYSSSPILAFVVECGYGVLCWRVYRGDKALLAAIVAFNLANVSFFFSAVPGPEVLLAGRPLLIVTIIFVQIVVTLLLVGVLSRQPTVSRA